MGIRMYALGLAAYFSSAFNRYTAVYLTRLYTQFQEPSMLRYGRFILVPFKDFFSDQEYNYSSMFITFKLIFSIVAAL